MPPNAIGFNERCVSSSWTPGTQVSISRSFAGTAGCIRSDLAEAIELFCEQLWSLICLRCTALGLMIFMTASDELSGTLT